MSPNEIALIRSMQGDAGTVRSKFDFILGELASGKINDDRILFELRQIVGKCDYISTTIESNFNRHETPSDVEISSPAEILQKL